VLSAVIPVFGNAASLRELHARLARVLEGLAESWEILFIDDASRDDSAAVLTELAALDPRVGVVLLAENVGQNRAVLCGLELARGDQLAVLDADLQDAPEALASLYRELEASGADVVFAARRGRYERAGRLLSSALYKRVLSLVSGVPTDAGLYLVLTRAGASRLTALRTRFVSVVAMIGCAGLAMRSVPIERAPRAGGGSAYSSLGRLHAAARALACVAVCRAPVAPAWLRQRARPAIRARLGAPFTASAR
jgi:polyisoprenyl-phosphate glycosyltransferase